MSTNGYMHNVTIRTEPHVEIHYDTPRTTETKNFWGVRKTVTVNDHHVINMDTNMERMSVLMHEHVEDIINPYEGLTLLKKRDKEIPGIGVVHLPQCILSNMSRSFEVNIVKRLYEHDFTVPLNDALEELDSELLVKNFHNMNFTKIIKKIDDMSDALVTHRSHKNIPIVQQFFTDVLQHEAGVHLCELWEHTMNTITDKKQRKEIQNGLFQDMLECRNTIKKSREEHNKIMEDSNKYAQQEINAVNRESIESQRQAIRELMMNTR